MEVKKPIKNSNSLHINSHNGLSANNIHVNGDRPNSVSAVSRPISTKYNSNNNINSNSLNINSNTNNNNNNNNISSLKPSTPNTNNKSEFDDDQLDPIPVYTNENN